MQTASRSVDPQSCSDVRSLENRAALFTLARNALDHLPCNVAGKTVWSTGEWRGDDEAQVEQDRKQSLSASGTGGLAVFSELGRLEPFSSNIACGSTKNS
jgi:hypothetical protein